MSTDHSTAILTLTTEKLSREESLKGIFISTGTAIPCRLQRLCKR